MAPVVLNSFHVPLVNNNYNFLTLGAINLFKKLLVLLIDEESLELGEESGAGLSVPVDHVLIQALLSEGSGADQ